MAAVHLITSRTRPRAPANTKEAHVFITRRPYALFSTDEGGIAGQAPEAETPDAGQPGTDQPTQAEIDWAKRYSDLQPEYTRATQEAAELRQKEIFYRDLVTSTDPDTRRQAAEALGFELEAEPDDTQYGDDPVAALQAQIAALQEQYTGDKQQQSQQQQIAHLEQVTEQALDGLKVPDEDGIRDWIVSRAVALPPNEQGFPDVKTAYEEFNALINAQKKSWATTKRAPHIAASGVEGNQAPKLHEMPRDQRDEYLARRLQDLSEG